MRNIFIVDAHIVDANGTFNFLEGYPKKFDSKNYSDDVDKTKKRAEGDASEVWGAMCKQDTRFVQTVTMSDIFGNVFIRHSMGDFAENTQAEEAETE
jgi:hypothetical protein